MKRWIVAAVLSVLSSGVAAANDCLAPLAPYDMRPPTSAQDDEMREIMNDEYKAYMREVGDYLNCLQAEFGRATEESHSVLKRWVEYFGDDAVLRIDVPDPARE